MNTQEFIFDLPLYTRVTISNNQVFKELCEAILLDGYNPIRGVDSTFYLTFPIDRRYAKEEGVNTLRFECQRYKSSMYVLVHYNINQDYIEKVGQYPSVADIHIAQIKKYKKVLGDSYSKDFTRAIGLAANGIGTGSFVYLRRVFEHIVSDIAEEAINSGEVERTIYATSKMDNKLKLLSNRLPNVINENKALYGVLSAGIHELSEEDCLRYFSVVRTIIELILDEREYDRQKDEKKKIAKSQLEIIAGNVKKEIKHL